MERSYARALLLAGLTLMGAGFLAYALFEALLPLTGAAVAAALTGALCLVPALLVALRGRKASPSVAAAAAATAVTAADAQIRSMAQTVVDNPLGAAATSALEGVAGILDPAKRRK